MTLTATQWSPTGAAKPGKPWGAVAEFANGSDLLDAAKKAIAAGYKSVDAWTPFYVQGVNLGVALPGRFPAEFPMDSALYAGWLDTISGMRANAVRVYTILPPAFYRALGGWNRTHPARALSADRVV